MEEHTKRKIEHALLPVLFVTGFYISWVAGSIWMFGGDIDIVLGTPTGAAFLICVAIWLAAIVGRLGYAIHRWRLQDPAAAESDEVVQNLREAMENGE